MFVPCISSHHHVMENPEWAYLLCYASSHAELLSMNLSFAFQLNDDVEGTIIHRLSWAIELF